MQRREVHDGNIGPLTSDSSCLRLIDDQRPGWRGPGADGRALGPMYAAGNPPLKDSRKGHRAHFCSFARLLVCSEM
jgi:hypothetical protein